MAVTEEVFTQMLRAVVDDVIRPQITKEIRAEFNRRFPPGLRYHPVYCDGSVIGYHPYVDTDEAIGDKNI